MRWAKVDFEGWCFKGVVAVLAVTGVLVLCAAYTDSQKPTFTLVKENFTCTQSHQQTRMQMVGKITVPIKETVCDQWTRK